MAWISVEVSEILFMEPILLIAELMPLAELLLILEPVAPWQAAQLAVYKACPSVVPLPLPLPLSPLPLGALSFHSTPWQAKQEGPAPPCKVEP